MKKKTLCSLLAAVMALGIFPAAVQAAEPLKTLTAPLDFRDVDTDCEDTDMGWRWKANSQKLILEDFRVIVPAGTMEKEAVIYLPDEARVEIEGENNAICSESYRCDIFYCDGEVNITGDGEIELSTKSVGSNVIYANRGPVIIDDEVEINIEPMEGRLIYVTNAKGDRPIISIQDDARIIFQKDDADARTILVTHKSSNKPADNWLDFAEIEDDWDDDYANLVAQDAVTTVKPADKEESTDEATPPAAEDPSAEPAVSSTYEITIGNAAIKKDGYVTYISDAKPYLSHGYTMLPLRALLNVTGADVELTWDAVTKTVSVKQNTDGQYFKSAMISVGEDHFICGDKDIRLSTPAELTDGRAFVSLRDWMNILSVLDMPASDLSWDSKTKTVTFVK